MPDPQHKLVKVDDSIIHFPGDMPDDDVAAVIKKFTSSPDYKKQTHTKSQMPSGIATEESEHKRLTGNVPTVTPDWNTVRKAVYKATEPTLPNQNTTPVNNTVKANVDAAWNAGANAANVGGNIAKRAGRMIFGFADMPIQVLSILKNLSSSDDKVSQQAETNLLNLHPGAQIADRLKEAVSDWRKSPSLATENALGDVLGFMLLDKAGKVLPEERIKQLNAEGVVLPPEAQPKTVPAKAGPTTIEGQFEKVPPKGFQPVQAAAKITRNEPPKLADVKAEAGKLVAPPKVEPNTQLTVKRPSFKEPDLSTAEVVFSAQRSPDHLYRGTNGEDELQNIIASQNIASTSETANRLGKSGHQGMTFFSDHPNVATSYVHNGGYVIEVDASKVPAVGNHGAGEIATSGPTPAGAITRIFRVGKDAQGYHAVDVTKSILPALTRQPVVPPAPKQETPSIPVAKQEVAGESKEVAPKTEQTTKYKFGNTQADIPQDSEAGQALATARTKIDKNDLMPSTNTADGSGLEENSHITVRYGIDGEDTAGIKAYLEKQAPFEATLGKTTAFPPSEHSDGGAPIVVNIESPELHRMENEIDAHGNFTERSFPEYKPHVTLGYVKPEAAQKYVGMSGMEGKKFTVNSVSISNKDGSIEEVPLKGTAPAATSPETVEADLKQVYKSPPASDIQLADAWRRLGDVKKELEGMPRPNDPKPTASPEEIERWKADYKAWAERAQPFLEKYKQATQQIEDLKNRGIGEIRLLPDKSRVLYLNRAGLNTLYHGMAGEARPGYTLSGVSLDPSNVKAIIGNLMIMKPPLYQELTDMMLRGMDKKGVVVSAIPRKGESLREALSTLREELNHGWQNTVADQMGNHLSPDKFAELNEVMPAGMQDHLTRNYPEITNDGSELMNRRRVREASAKMLSEAPQKLGLTEDEAAAYLFQYFNALEEAHGEKALDNLLHITALAKEIKDDYFNSTDRGNQRGKADQGDMGGFQEGRSGGAPGTHAEEGQGVPAGAAAKVEAAMKQVENATPEKIANIEQKILASNHAYKSANSLASGSPGAAVAKGAITREEAAQYSKAKGFFNEFNDLSAPGPKPPKERIGTEEPDGRAPSVNWHRQDLQDSGAISDEQLLKDYNGGKPALVYPSFIDINDMPDPVLAEEQDDEFEEEGSGYPWEDFRFSSSRGIPPMKIAITPHGDIEILDGNHRLKYWTDQGYTSFPAWVIDKRKGKISGLSEEEEDKLAAIKRAAAKLKTPAAAKQVTVRDPEGYVHTFPDEASAAKFRAAAGIQ